MNYSRVLQVEHEQEADNHGEGAYTIFNVIQPFTLDFKKPNIVSIQTLAVLWNDVVDTRLIWMIEQALIGGVLAPVKLLEASNGTLNVMYNSQISQTNFLQFEEAWSSIAECAWYDDWTAEFFKDTQPIPLFSGGRVFRTYAPRILSDHILGIQEFTDEMFLHHEAWTPESMGFVQDTPDENGISNNDDLDENIPNQSKPTNDLF